LQKCEENASHVAGGLAKGCNYFGNNMAVPQNVKYRLSI
jgi:hypothetical protein